MHEHNLTQFQFVRAESSSFGLIFPNYFKHFFKKALHETRSVHSNRAIEMEDASTYLVECCCILLPKHNAYCADMFVKCSQTTSYRLRSASNNNYFIRRLRCEYQKKSFSYRGAYLRLRFPCTPSKLLCVRVIFILINS